jgi:hypothetical protein
MKWSQLNLLKDRAMHEGNNPSFWNECLYILYCSVFTAKAGDTSDEIRQNQLKLALTWDRADIAQEEIFREDVLWPTGK